MTNNNSVTCYPGDTYPSRPKSFVYKGQDLDVADMLSTWCLPMSIGFRVMTRDREVYELIYRPSEEHWEVLHVFDE